MATSPRSPKAASGARTQQDLEADIAQLRDDFSELLKQLQTTSEHSYGTARRAASEGVDQLRVQGEAAIETLRASAGDIEKQLTASVRDKPFTSLAVAAGVGFLFALLARR
ncbi:MAG: YqjD family protein [Rhizobiaceae bacterium]